MARKQATAATAKEDKPKTKVYTDEPVDARRPVMGNRGGMLNAGRGSYVVREGQEADGVIGLMRVPSDAIVFGGYLFGEDADGNPVDVGGEIGWLDNAIDEEDLAGIKGLGEMQPVKFSAQTVIVAKCSAAPGTKVSVVTLYVVD